MALWLGVACVGPRRQDAKEAGELKGLRTLILSAYGFTDAGMKELKGCRTCTP